MYTEKHAQLTQWNKIKLSLHGKRPPKFCEGEIWWTHIGENVGTEINGKGDYFTRPVLILRKLDHKNFIGIPLSTKLKTHPWYTSFRFQRQIICAVIANTRHLSASRLFGEKAIGEISRIDLVRIRTSYHKLIFGY